MEIDITSDTEYSLRALFQKKGETAMEKKENRQRIEEQIRAALQLLDGWQLKLIWWIIREMISQ